MSDEHTSPDGRPLEPETPSHDATPRDGAGSDRRTFLQRAGTLATAGFAAAWLPGETGATAPDRLPVYARGTILREYRYEPETITFEEWYVSDDLRRRYGVARTRFEHLVMKRPSPETDPFPLRGTRTDRAPLGKLVGSESEWRGHYRGQGGQVGTLAKSDYSGPIWTYGKSNDGLYTRTAPINFVWESPDDGLQYIRNTIIDFPNDGLRDWTGTLECNSNKFVYYSSLGSFVEQDDALATDNLCIDPRDHLRLWHDRNGDFGGSGGQFEIGSVHHDPAGHTCIEGIAFFTFEPPEQRLEDGWKDHTSHSVSTIDLDNAETWGNCRKSNDDSAVFINI